MEAFKEVFTNAVSSFTWCVADGSMGGNKDFQVDPSVVATRTLSWFELDISVVLILRLLEAGSIPSSPSSLFGEVMGGSCFESLRVRVVGGAAGIVGRTAKEEALTREVEWVVVVALPPGRSSKSVSGCTTDESSAASEFNDFRISFFRTTGDEQAERGKEGNNADCCCEDGRRCINLERTVDPLAQVRCSIKGLVGTATDIMASKNDCRDCGGCCCCCDEEWKVLLLSDSSAPSSSSPAYRARHIM